jgi:hypothetical protein
MTCRAASTDMIAALPAASGARAGWHWWWEISAACLHRW